MSVCPTGLSCSRDRAYSCIGMLAFGVLAPVYAHACVYCVHVAYARVLVWFPLSLSIYIYIYLSLSLSLSFSFSVCFYYFRPCSSLLCVCAPVSASPDRRDAIIFQVMSWYYIGIVLLCCGIPSAVLGIKRFPNRLWVCDRSSHMDTPVTPSPHTHTHTPLPPNNTHARVHSCVFPGTSLFCVSLL